ncbi:MAG: DUF2934 domain-containing protein [Candidatus Omnitrophica bacterium]|nr:DUF2934 domain-containing protein [Candidatus Omnitrophota bacterium]
MVTRITGKKVKTATGAGAKKAAVKTAAVAPRASAKLTASVSKKIPVSADQFSEFVRTRAYYLWQDSGQPVGKDYELWLQAEKEISARYAAGK